MRHLFYCAVFLFLTGVGVAGHAQVIMQLGDTEFSYDPATGQPTSAWSSEILMSGAAEPVIGLSFDARVQFLGFNSHPYGYTASCGNNRQSYSGTNTTAVAIDATITFDPSNGVFSQAEFVEVIESYSRCYEPSLITYRSLRVGIVESLQGPFSGQVLDSLVPIGSLTFDLLVGNVTPDRWYLDNDLDGASAIFGGPSFIQPASPTEVTYVSGASESFSGLDGEVITWARSNSFKRGHFEAPLSLTISDPLRALLYLFGGGEAPVCRDSIDSNDDGLIDLADPLLVLAYLFSAGPTPLEPFFECGSDLTIDNLECEIDICQ